LANHTTKLTGTASTATAPSQIGSSGSCHRAASPGANATTGRTTA
jgi:hypothetical protein